MAVTAARVLRDDLMFAESPRWHDGRLYVADFYAKEVVAIGLDGERETIVSVPAQPSGFGWLPGGDLLVTSMRDATVLRFDGEEALPVATVTTSPVLNHMAVSGEGRAYVGGMPDLYTLLGPGSGAIATEVTLEPERLYLVEAGGGSTGGEARVVAEALEFPNEIAITPDGRTLLIAETMAMRLTAFDIASDGSLSGKRLWAQLSYLPDGFCLDADGCAWVAVPERGEDGFIGFLRVAEGGEILDRHPIEAHAIACALGGPEGNDLFMLEADVVAVAEIERASVRGNARVSVGKVEVPAAEHPDR